MPSNSAITVTDMTGRSIVLEQPVQRVVALTAAVAEITAALDAGDLLVGRGQYCDYPAEILDLPAVQSGEEVNLEQIIALSPDVVLMSTMAQSEEQASALQKAGIACVMSEAHDIAGIYDSIALIGQVVGKEEKAAQLVADMQADFQEIRDKIPQDAEKKSIYFEVSPLEYGLWAAGNHTFMNEIADMLGMENIFADMEGWGTVSQEQVIERNPDYIITITMSYEGGPQPIDEISGRKGWETITAVAEGQLIPAAQDEITRPGPRLVDAAADLYARVYEQA